MKHSVIVFVLLYCTCGISPVKGIPTAPPVDEEEIESQLSLLATGAEVTDEDAQWCQSDYGWIPAGGTVNKTLCEQCTCFADGELRCEHVFCPKVDCVDFENIEGECCSICPNGKSLQIL